jgi:hypothetical protein
MSYGNEGGRRHRVDGMHGAAVTQRAEHALVQRRGGRASAPAATFMGDPVAMVRGGLRMARRELSVLENSLARLRAAVSPDGARDMDEARQRAAMAQIHLERVRRAVDSAARWLPLVPELAEELAAMRAAYDQAVGETEALRGQAPPDYRDRDRLVATAGQPGSEALFAEDEARAQGEWNDSLDERAARDRRREQAPATIDAAPSYDEDRGTIDLDAMGGSEPAVATPAPARRLDRGAEQAPVTIDAPPSYDEDRGTIDLDGVDVRERPAEAAPAPLDRRAERAAATIDAPPSYDEDRGTLDLDAMRGRDAAAAPAPAHRLDRRAEQAAVTIDAAPSYDEDRGTIDIDAMRARDVDGGAAMRDAPRVAAVQRRASDSAVAVADPHAIAAAGLTGAGGPLPHLDAIQRSFGAHDGGAAATASVALGAEAYATGDHVAFAAAPSLHTAAHEAAHVIQQQAGVSLKGGVGEAGDAYEQHADAVADAVVRGESAEALLGPVRAGAAPAAVQRKRTTGAGTDTAGEVAPEELLGMYRDAYARIRRILDELRKAEHNPGRAAELETVFAVAEGLHSKLEGRGERAVRQEVAAIKESIDALYPVAVTVMSRHGVRVATDIPIVDEGLRCEHDAQAAGCFLTAQQRNRLVGMLGDFVLSAMGNFHAAVTRARIDRRLAPDSNAWGFWAEFLFAAATGPLIGVALKGFSNLKKAIQAAKVPDFSDILNNIDEKSVGILKRAILKVPDEAVSNVLTSASKGLRGELKDAAKSDGQGGAAGWETFLNLIEEGIKPIGDSLVSVAPAGMNDVELVALTRNYGDAKAHSVASYLAIIDDMLDRYTAQGLDTINRKHEDGGVDHPVIIEAYGHRRTATIEEHGTKVVGVSRRGMDDEGHVERGSGISYFTAFVDEELAPLAEQLHGKGLEVIHVDETLEHLPFQFRKESLNLVHGVTREGFLRWVTSCKAKPKSPPRFAPKPIVTPMSPEDIAAHDAGDAADEALDAAGVMMDWG